MIYDRFGNTAELGWVHFEDGCTVDYRFPTSILGHVIISVDEWGDTVVRPGTIEDLLGAL